MHAILPQCKAQRKTNKLLTAVKNGQTVGADTAPKSSNQNRFFWLLHVLYHFLLLCSGICFSYTNCHMYVYVHVVTFWPVGDCLFLSSLRTSKKQTKCPSHLHGLYVEDIFSENRQEVLAHAFTLVLQRSAACLHAAGHPLQGALQLLLRRRPTWVHGAVLAQFCQVL